MGTNQHLWQEGKKRPYRDESEDDDDANDRTVLNDTAVPAWLLSKCGSGYATEQIEGIVAHLKSEMDQNRLKYKVKNLISSKDKSCGGYDDEVNMGIYDSLVCFFAKGLFKTPSHHRWIITKAKRSPGCRALHKLLPNLGRREGEVEYPYQEVQKLLSNGSFYYSTDFDLTNRRQDRLVDPRNLFAHLVWTDTLRMHFYMRWNLSFYNLSQELSMLPLEADGSDGFINLKYLQIRLIPAPKDGLDEDVLKHLEAMLSHPTLEAVDIYGHPQGCRNLHDASGIFGEIQHCQSLLSDGTDN
ncbi:hypothetical protein PG987_001516 [Apiospora arundinis]